LLKKTITNGLTINFFFFSLHHTIYCYLYANFDSFSYSNKYAKVDYIIVIYDYYTKNAIYLVTYWITTNFLNNHIM